MWFVVSDSSNFTNKTETLKQSARLAVSSNSNTTSFKPNTSLAGIPTGVSLGKMKIPVFVLQVIFQGRVLILERSKAYH